MYTLHLSLRGDPGSTVLLPYLVQVLVLSTCRDSARTRVGRDRVRVTNCTWLLLQAPARRVQVSRRGKRRIDGAD